jgi:cell division septum initiation protein DivIVA
MKNQGNAADQAKNEANTAANKATEAMTHAGQAVGSAASAVGQKASDLASSVAHKAQDAASSMASKAQDAAGTVGHKAEDATATVGHGMQTLAGKVRDNTPNEGMLGSASNAVADAIEGAGKYVEDKNLTGMVDDMTGLIRRNPVPALFLALGVGFLIGRALSSRS